MRWRLLRDWVESAVRVALRGADHELAEDLATQARTHAARNPAVPTATGVAAQALGLLGNDLALLEEYLWPCSRLARARWSGPPPTPISDRPIWRRVTGLRRWPP